jgi:general secretion pathway protein L
MERQALEVRAEAVATFRKMFPDEKRIVNLRRQAETRLAAGSGGASDAMRGMAALAGSLASSEVSGVSVQEMRYSAEGDALGVEFRAASLAQIDRLEQLLAGAGMSAKVLSASEEGGVATARVELRAL